MSVGHCVLALLLLAQRPALDVRALATVDVVWSRQLEAEESLVS